jgi:AraC family transcriptional regulator of adaptative response/methylated-DNA-[protein]-cysteine methyltransferase
MTDSPVVARVTEVETPIGEMVAVASDAHLLLLEFARRRMLDTQLERVRRAIGCDFVDGESPIVERLRDQLDEYFRGARREFDVPIYAPGTPFQMRVWDELRRIPIGTTTSYGRIAAAIGEPTAVRAVARANGDNRISILIPCHRVIGSDGSLTGYGGGLWRKKRLLDLEASVAALRLPGFD